MLYDSNSAAGTFVNGQRVSQKDLKTGDLIKIGDTDLRFEGDLAEQATLPPTPGPAKGGARPGAGKPAAAPVKQLADLVGQTLSHYHLERVLAAGQTGLVFYAKDTNSGQEVAFKVMKPEFSQNEDERQRFIRGMKTMLPVRHPNLVSLYNAGQTGAYCWMAMEYIDGESLTQVIRRVGVGGRLDWVHAFRVAVHIGRALDFAHKQHIIHRNVLPQNIMIQSSDKVAKLGDLMLAKALEGTMAKQVTRPGELVGDIHYMAPERTRDTIQVDGRSDIYGLGATCYALLAGRPPFEASSLVEMITKIRTAEPEKPKKFQLSIPDQFEGIVMQMLAKRPEERYQTAAELLVDLDRVAKFNNVTV